MSLPAIVSDQNCLSYFVQYLESKNALPLIKFYLDTENFKTAALTQIEIEEKLIKLSELDNAQSAVEEQVLEKTEQNKILCDKVNEEESNVPELKTLCDLSMRKPLTDDEKSQIYAETNKQITKCCNASATSKIISNSELSLCSEEQSPDELHLEDNAKYPVKNGYVTAASIKDAIAIYQKYLIPNSQQFVSLPVTILSHISLLLCKREDDKETSTCVECIPISANCFLEAQHYVLEQLENNFLLDFLQSTFYCKYCIELIENANNGLGSKLTIFDILYSEVTLFFFMEFLEQEQERDCLDFWTAAINYRKSYVDEINRLGGTAISLMKTENLAQADAMIIYEKYFSLQCPSEYRLWLSDKLRSKVEESICAVGNVAKCFDLPLQVIAKYLETKHLEKFLNSQLFANYLNELKLKIRESTLSNTDITANHSVANIMHSNTAKAKSSRHRKTMSDCTNEDSRVLLKHISQQNTLLAMESHTTNHLKLHGSASLSIDSRQLTNPKMLWKRYSSTEGGLKFGRVNSLGRYERDFDAVDAAYGGTAKNSWSLTMGSSKIKSAMRKLVNLPEDKVQEEIAWQVAEMIVKDVTSITLCDEKQNSINPKP